MIRKGRRGSRVDIILVQQIPLIVAKKLVNTTERGVLSLIAPCVSRVLTFQFLQPCPVKSAPELAHQSSVQIVVAFVTSLVDHVEIPVDHPGLTGRWGSGRKI